MSLIRQGTKLTASHQTIPFHTLGYETIEVRLELDDVPSGDVTVKALHCFDRGAWGKSVELWSGDAIVSDGVYSQRYTVPTGVDGGCILLEPSQSCTVRSLDVLPVR